MKLTRVNTYDVKPKDIENLKTQQSNVSSNYVGQDKSYKDSSFDSSIDLREEYMKKMIKMEREKQRLEREGKDQDDSVISETNTPNRKREKDNHPI